MLPSVLNARAPSLLPLSLNQVIKQIILKYRELPKAPSLQKRLGKRCLSVWAVSMGHYSYSLPKLSLCLHHWHHGVGLDVATFTEGCSTDSAGAGRTYGAEAIKAEACLGCWGKGLWSEWTGDTPEIGSGEREGGWADRASTLLCLRTKRIGRWVSASHHRVFPSQMSWFPLLMLQKWLAWNKSRAPADRHPPAVQCEYWEAPGRNTVLLGASCPIFCTRAAPCCCAVMRVGQEQSHIQPATGPRETLLNHVQIHMQIQSYGYH